jgi:hypothetical protein
VEFDAPFVGGLVANGTKSPTVQQLWAVENADRDVCIASV